VDLRINTVCLEYPTSTALIQGMTVKIIEESYLSRLLVHAHIHHNVGEVLPCQTVFRCGSTEWNISKDWRHTQVILQQHVSTAKF